MDEKVIERLGELVHGISYARFHAPISEECLNELNDLNGSGWACICRQASAPCI